MPFIEITVRERESGGFWITSHYISQKNFQISAFNRKLFPITLSLYRAHKTKLDLNVILFADFTDEMN